MTMHVTAAVPAGESGRDLQKMVATSPTGLAIPSQPIEANLDMAAAKATAWSAGAAQRILLDGDVRLTIGAYGFKAERAVVVITPQQSPGVNARYIAVYFDQVRELGGYGPIKQAAPRLLVTATLIGKVTLKTDSMHREPADGDPMVVAALDRVNRYEQAVAANTKPLPDGAPLVDPAAFAQRDASRRVVRDVKVPDVPPPMARQTARAATGARRPGQVETGAPVVPGAATGSPEAAVDFRADSVVYKHDEDEGYILLSGDITVMYTDPQTSQHMTLRADRAVIFTDPKLMSAGGGATPADKIHGVYLEDNVIATDGQYTLRGPRIYYDIQTNQAVVLQAVFFTWDVDKQVPLYVRADKLRQHSLRQWSAEGARLSTSDFYEPHFFIGADKLTVTAEEQPAGGSAYRFQADGVRLNAGSTSLFYWPSVSGKSNDAPLRTIDVGSDSRYGAKIQTKWDLFALLNTDKPRGVDAELLVDGYTKRGPGVGINLDYDVDKAYGELESYYLFDQGEDEPGGREEVDPQTEHRSRVLWRHRHELPDDWEATAQFAYLSDPTFLEEFFEREAYASQEYETSLYLKQQRDDWAFSFLAKYDIQDFVAQSDLMQTRGNIPGGNTIGAGPIGYTTDKLPELAYYRIGTSLWEDRLTWYSENRASVMRLNLPEDTPGERGFNPAESVALFGIANTAHFDTALTGAGLDEHTRYRMDTRQEIDAPLQFGDVIVTPYAVGRVTAYSEDFNNYAGEDDNVRLWGALGVRASTAFSKTYNDVESRLFDVHRIRHIIEPSINLFYAETTIQQESLPVYDYEVESLAEGGVMEIGLRNTFQTQRGGEGRWRSVDWVRIDTKFVTATDEVQRESFIGRFFDHRPELSLVDDYIENEVAWQVTDTFAVFNEVNYNSDRGEIEQWNLGFQLDHSPRLATFAQLRMIDELGSFIATYGFEYLLTPKYHIGFAQSFDIYESRTRNVTVTLTRRLPRTLLILAMDFDTVSEVSSIGIALAPEGLGGKGDVTENPFLFRRD
ncbi:LPS assembly protein LptD [Planctomycetales bacterium ZRK34]|nr:LPS assembly protein LptD [Planctomycetales bacterium ZRK34]